MKKSKNEIEAILRAEDVEGLLHLGAPSDEYSCEAERIAELLKSKESMTSSDLAQIVKDVCTASFGPFSEDQLAKRLPVYNRIGSHLVSPD